MGSSGCTLCTKESAIRRGSQIRTGAMISAFRHITASNFTTIICVSAAWHVIRTTCQTTHKIDNDLRGLKYYVKDSPSKLLSPQHWAETAQTSSLCQEAHGVQHYVAFEAIKEWVDIEGEQHPMLAFAASADPDTYYHEAMREPDRAKFIKAMEKEVKSHTGSKVTSPSRNQDSSSSVGHEAQVPNCNQGSLQMEGKAQH
ncbi:hypothetical protein MHU86_2791 [Fragilaria crotonensis]|nr:hypothetical protein MHU86_2791 [Fragilaria crotonensis]